MFTSHADVTAPEFRETPRVLATLSRGYRAQEVAVEPPEMLPPGVDASRRLLDRSQPHLRERRAVAQSARSNRVRAASDRARRRRGGGGVDEQRLPGGRAGDGFNIGENRDRELGRHHPDRRVSDNASDAREAVPRRFASRCRVSGTDFRQVRSMDINAERHLFSGHLRYALETATKRDAALLAVHGTPARSNIRFFLAGLVCEVR